MLSLTYRQWREAKRSVLHRSRRETAGNVFADAGQPAEPSDG